MSAAARRSWKPVGRMVVWQLQKSGALPAKRAMTTVATRSSNLLCRVTIESTFSARPLGVGGGAWTRSATSSSSPHIRVFSSGSSNSAQLAKEEESTEEVRKDVEHVEKSSQTKTVAKDDSEVSNYWGVTTNKSFVREDGTSWPWNCFRPKDTYSPDVKIDLLKHRVPTEYNEKFALWAVKTIKIPVNLFFRTRYGCRAMMLETVAAVPGMVGGMLLHLRSLRRFEHSGGWIKALLDEAENERMHLMTLMDIVKPAWYERALVVIVQGIFFNFYFFLYVMSPRLAHRVTGYLEEEAIISYTTFLKEIDAGVVENVPAPPIAIDYWRLPKDAKFRDVIVALRADEAHHRDVNHYAADVRHEGKQLHESPAPVDYH